MLCDRSVSNGLAFASVAMAGVRGVDGVAINTTPGIFHGVNATYV